MKKRTTIQIEKELLEKLKAKRTTKRDTYNEIIERLLRSAKKPLKLK